MHPTPELWTLSLPHRTQILYTTDISMVILQLDIKPGSIVVEAGTGSGSLSHSFIRTLQPSGKLLTFEFHEKRSKKAREEFKDHGLEQYVTVTHRDVCGTGFLLNNVADAVFLDLPRPWDCIASAKQAIKKQGGRICSFPPCMEQVQRSTDEMARLGFSEINTLEVLQRSYNIQYAKMQNMDIGDSLEDDNVLNNSESLMSNEKEALFVNEISEKTDIKIDECCTPAKVAKQGNKKDTEQQNAKKSEVSSFCFTSAVPALNMQGHTGFLTFASLYANP